MSSVWPPNAHAASQQLNDLAILDVSDPDLQTVKWLSMPSANKPPPPRGYHTFTQVDNSHAVLFGGSDGSVSCVL